MFECRSGVREQDQQGVEVAVSHGVGGMFAASGTIVMSNQKP